MDADPERLKKHMSVCFEIMVHLAEIYYKLRSPENPETIQSLPAGLENPGLEMMDCPSPPPDGEEDSDDMDARRSKT